MVMEPSGVIELKTIYHQYIICQDTYITAYPVHSNNLGFCAATASTNLAQSALAAILSHDIVWIVWSSSLKAVQAEDLRPKPKPEPGLTVRALHRCHRLCHSHYTDRVLRIPSHVIQPWTHDALEI
ncbi:hypothetical protein GB937_007069 [Aspergillus fischeri]|nr:hypothetical protein GB937_007069 [Aspergillus fischeri]